MHEHDCGEMQRARLEAKPAHPCACDSRGPFIRGCIVDLPVPAAPALGMTSAGVVGVSVE
jgi:hypothetical protein